MIDLIKVSKRKDAIARCRKLDQGRHRKNAVFYHSHGFNHIYTKVSQLNINCLYDFMSAADFE